MSFHFLKRFRKSSEREQSRLFQFEGEIREYVETELDRVIQGRHPELCWSRTDEYGFERGDEAAALGVFGR
jgi:hypothetical protein